MGRIKRKHDARRAARNNKRAASDNARAARRNKIAASSARSKATFRRMSAEARQDRIDARQRRIDRERQELAANQKKIRRLVLLPIPGKSKPCSCHLGQACIKCPPKFACIHDIAHWDNGVFKYKLKPVPEHQKCCSGSGYTIDSPMIQVKHDARMAEAALGRMCANAQVDWAEEHSTKTNAELATMCAQQNFFAAATEVYQETRPRVQLTIPIPGRSMTCRCPIGQAYARSPPKFVCIRKVANGRKTPDGEFIWEWKFTKAAENTPCCKGSGYTLNSAMIQVLPFLDDFSKTPEQIDRECDIAAAKYGFGPLAHLPEYYGKYREGALIPQAQPPPPVHTSPMGFDRMDIPRAFRPPSMFMMQHQLRRSAMPMGTGFRTTSSSNGILGCLPCP